MGHDKQQNSLPDTRNVSAHTSVIFILEEEKQKRAAARYDKVKVMTVYSALM